MKYTIPAIDQRAAITLGDVDLIECHLLQWLFYFCTGGARPVGQEDLLSELPLVAAVVPEKQFKNLLESLADKGYLIVSDMGVATTEKVVPLLWGSQT
jgi:hypothetical protein